MGEVNVLYGNLILLYGNGHRSYGNHSQTYAGFPLQSGQLLYIQKNQSPDAFLFPPKPQNPNLKTI